MLLEIAWNVNPDITELGPFTLRWYGILFATGFFLALTVEQYMFRHEKLPERWLEIGFIFVFVGTIIGARLGHVFFYDWDYYSQHLADIPKVWKGGLASHGAVIGIFIALWLYSKYITKRPMIWIVDRATAVIPLAGAFIRLGNLMNHEIYGQPTDLPWGFVFKLVGDGVPRHPSQIYEALAYLLIFAILMYMYWKTDAKDRPGLLSGVFFVGVFGFRILVEFLKENQSAFEANLPLNMGQILSIPLVLVGVFLIVRAYQRDKVYYEPPVEPEKKDNKKKAKKSAAKK